MHMEVRGQPVEVSAFFPWTLAVGPGVIYPLSHLTVPASLQSVVPSACINETFCAIGIVLIHQRDNSWKTKTACSMHGTYLFGRNYDTLIILAGLKRWVILITGISPRERPMSQSLSPKSQLLSVPSFRSVHR